MSLLNFFNDLFHANFGNAWSRFSDFFGNDLSPALEAWVKKFATDEGKLLLNTAEIFAQQVLSGTAIKDAAAALITQLATTGVTIAENDALDAIRTQLSSIQVP